VVVHDTAVSNNLSLTDRLADAARAAVLERRAAIEAGGTGNLRAVTVEAELANGGGVLDVTAHLSWKHVIREARRGS